MPLPAVLRRPEPHLVSTEEVTTRYQLDARLVRAQRAARQVRLGRELPASRALLLDLTGLLREYAGGGADRLVLGELDRLGLTLDRVPMALLGELIVSLAKRLDGHDAQYGFARRASRVVNARAA
jgi:hypothetical protein